MDGELAFPFPNCRAKFDYCAKFNSCAIARRSGPVDPMLTMLTIMMIMMLYLQTTCVAWMSTMFIPLQMIKA